jgi:hypothetical protein
LGIAIGFDAIRSLTLTKRGAETAVLVLQRLASFAKRRMPPIEVTGVAANGSNGAKPRHWHEAMYLLVTHVVSELRKPKPQSDGSIKWSPLTTSCPWTLPPSGCGPSSGTNIPTPFMKTGLLLAALGQSTTA